MVQTIHTELEALADAEKAELLGRFFKTDIGEYGEGDRFMGITVPMIRKIAKRYSDSSLDRIDTLLASQWHEERLLGLLILVMQFKKADTKKQELIYCFYLSHTARINNWDLVDTSARDIVGAYLYAHQDQLNVLEKLSASPLLWERRIAIIATFYFLNKGDPEPTLKIAHSLLRDDHDLIQKANGWMLRELGKRVDQTLLVNFLKQNYNQIPRTTLRYAIEHFDKTTRGKYLKGIF